MPERPPSRLPSKPPPPKDEADDMDFVFLKESEEKKPWEAEWNAEAIARCKALIKKIGWQVTGDLTSIEPQVLKAFDHVFQEDVEQFGGRIPAIDKEKIRAVSLGQMQYVANQILRGIIPHVDRPPSFFGDILERMAAYLEAHPRRAE